MTSTEEGSDPADDALKRSEDEAPNDCGIDVEPSFAESNMMSQVEMPLMNRELDLACIQEHTAPQQPENNELEVKKKQKDLQEDLKEETLLIQIPIPRKRIFLRSGLGRTTQLNTSLVQMDGKKFLDNRATFCSGNMRETSNLCYTTTIYKIPFHFSISWRRSFISRHVMRGMTLRLLCGRIFSHAAGHQNIKWLKQQYTASLTNPNVNPREERAIIFRRPLRAYHYHSLPERMTLKRMHKSPDTKGGKNLCIFLRRFIPCVHFIPHVQFQNASHRKCFEDHLRSLHNIRVVIIHTSDGWKFLCPICERSFNNLFDFRQHFCNSLGN